MHNAARDTPGALVRACPAPTPGNHLRVRPLSLWDIGLFHNPRNAGGDRRHINFLSDSQSHNELHGDVT